MADTNDEVLRRSLDAVDRHRTRLWIAIIALAVLLVFVFVHGAWASRGGRDTAQAILAHYFMLLIWMTALTLIVILQITVMTKRILRAIDLASKK
jgi:uncharacterized membrane protein